MSEVPGVTKKQKQMMDAMKRARRSVAHGRTWEAAYEAGFVEASRRAVEVARLNGLDPGGFYTDMTTVRGNEDGEDIGGESKPDDAA